MTRTLGGAPFLALALCALAGLAPGQEAPRQQLANGGMEEGDPGQSPSGWFFHTNCGATAAIDTDKPFVGSKSAWIDASKPTGKERPFTNLMQSLDGKTWQGK